jgi:hypothetical protein
MKYTSMTSVTVEINPSVPGHFYLRDFRMPHVSSIKSVKTGLPKHHRKVTFELISFGHTHKISDAIRWIRDWKNREFATPYELLAVDFRYDELQMKCELVTPDFTLGVDPEDISECVPRSVFGKVIEDTKPNRSVQSSTRYLTRPYVTDVDKIDIGASDDINQYDAWLDGYLREKLSTKLFLQ